MRLRPLAAAFLAAAPLTRLAPTPAWPRAGLTLAQVERNYPRMSAVHILKCDHNGDQVFTRIELLCVAGIYQAMYIAD